MSDSDSGSSLDLDNVSLSSESEAEEETPKIPGAFVHHENPEMTGAVEVVYCEICGLPPRYCDVGPTPANCLANWLAEDKEFYLNLTGKSLEEVEEAAKSAAAAPKKEKKEKEPAVITIQSVARTKRKTVTVVTNLEKFNIKLKDASKIFQNKFACGAAVVKNPNPGLPDAVEIQGDFEYDVAEVICNEFSNVDPKNIVILKGKN